VAGVNSPPTLAAVPTRGSAGCSGLKERRRWPPRHTFAETYADVHGRSLARGRSEMLVAQRAWPTPRAGDRAVPRRARRVLAFLARTAGDAAYNGPDGRPAGGGFVADLEDSISQGPWRRHRVRLAEQIAGWTTCRADRPGDLPGDAGDPFGRTREQMARFADDVLPLLPRRHMNRIYAELRAPS